MGIAPMVPLPAPEPEPVEEEDEEEEYPPTKSAYADTLPTVARNSAIPAPPGRKSQAAASDDHNVYYAVGSPTSVVDLFQLCTSTWHRSAPSTGDDKSERPQIVQDAMDTPAVSDILEVQSTSVISSVDCSMIPHKAQTGSCGDLVDSLTDDLILHVMDFLDVKAAMLLFGSSSRRIRLLARDWFPWRCMDLRHWLSIPNHRAKISDVYGAAMRAFDSRLDCTREDIQSRRIKLSHFLGNVGLYRQGEELLSGAIFDITDCETRADQLLALAYIKWRAQQARHGGDECFLWSIVVAAMESVELRRTLTGRNQKRKLALALEVLAENAACYGHCLLAMAMDGMETGEEEREGDRRLLAPFDLADEAVRECLEIWERMGDDEKLADAWAASASVDFYAGRNFEGALSKLTLAQSICAQARLLSHPTHALVLFNMAYIRLIAFHRAEEAAGLFAQSLAIREEVLGPAHPFSAATRAELSACLRLLRDGGGGGDDPMTDGSAEEEDDEDDEFMSSSSGGGGGGGGSDIGAEDSDAASELSQ